MFSLKYVYNMSLCTVLFKLLSYYIILTYLYPLLPSSGKAFVLVKVICQCLGGESHMP